MSKKIVIRHSSNHHHAGEVAVDLTLAAVTVLTIFFSIYLAF